MAITPSTLRGVAVSPSGVPIPGATVTIRTVQPSDNGTSFVAFVAASHLEVLSPLTLKAGTDGSWSTQLIGTGDLGVGGAAYSAVYKHGNVKFPPVYFDLPNDGATYWIGDRIIGGPTVIPRILTSITITPTGPSIVAAQTLQLHAIGHYSDGTTTDITTACTWASSIAGVATIGASTGLATGVAAGGTSITATGPGQVGTTSLAVTPSAPPPPVLLVGGIQVRYMGATPADMDLMKSLGATWVRVTFDLSVAANAGNTSNPIAGIDTNLGGAPGLTAVYAHSIGLKVLAVMAFQPGWMGTYHQIPQDSTHRGYWNAVAVAMVNAYHTYIDAVEIWNEPNHDAFNATPSMATIRPFMHDAVLAMRAAQPGLIYMPGGPASDTTRTAEAVAKWDAGPSASGAVSIGQATYLDGLYGSGGIVGGTTPGTAFMDALAVHSYTGNLVPDYNFYENPLYHPFRDMPGVGDGAVWGTTGGVSNGFNYMDDIIGVRDPGKQLWMTEAGWYGGSTVSGASLTESDAANYALIGLTWWRTQQQAGLAGPYFYFELRDQAVVGASGNKEDYLGMYHKNGDGTYTAKPQLAMYQALVGA